MPKWLALSIKGHNHDPRACTEPLKPKWLTVGDHGLRNMRLKPVCSYTGILSSNREVPSFFAKMSSPNLPKYQSIMHN